MESEKLDEARKIQTELDTIQKTINELEVKSKTLVALRDHLIRQSGVLPFLEGDIIAQDVGCYQFEKHEPLTVIEVCIGQTYDKTNFCIRAFEVETQNRQRVSCHMGSGTYVIEKRTNGAK